MRAIWLAIAAVIQVGIAPGLAQDAGHAVRSLGEKLPLFAQNHCDSHKDPANQLFCADPALIAAGTKLSAAIQDRLNRLPDRLLAVEETAEWISERNQSCGIFGREAVRYDDVERVAACLLTETEERTLILRDPNFDCLAAANTAAGTLICSDPTLADDEQELNKDVVRLVGKLNETDSKDAYIEYARWTRDRDRQCNLVGRDNVPLEELSPSEDCVADFMRRKTAEIVAANGDPKKVFGRRLTSPLPNADAVDLCVTQIHAANSCGDFVRIRRVSEVDSQIADQNALVTADVEMIVLAPFAVCSPVASSCTGKCWDANQAKQTAASRDSFPVSRRIRVEKAFAFQKADKDGWRCNVTTLQPVNLGVALGNR
jgi:uncharacterized protein YecT (DUF1311 family)